MNKAKKILGLTEVHYGIPELASDLADASESLSDKWKTVNSLINKTAGVLQTPVDSENAKKVISFLTNLSMAISDFEGKLSTLDIRVMDVRGELQDKQDRGEL